MEEFIKLTELVLQIFEVKQNPQSFLILFFLAFARFFSFIAMVPFLGGQIVPNQVKVATATALVILTYPALISELPAETNSFGFGVVGFAGLIAKEMFVGFTLGFVASLVFEAALIAGRITDLQRGSTMGEFLSQETHFQYSELGQFKLYLAIVIFLTTGAHNIFITSLIKSFEFIPALKFPNIASNWTSMAEFLIVLTGNILSIGVQLAVPIVITLLLTDLLFGLINRTAPQINVFFLSMPVKMWIGIFVLLVMLPFLVERFRELFDFSYKSFETVIQQFSKLY